MWDKDEIERVVSAAREQIGKDYEIGGYEEKDGKKVWVTKGKPAISDQNPTAFDCSGFARWVIGQGTDIRSRRIILPHGCMEMIKVLKPIAGVPRALDIGFANLDSDAEPDHCILKLEPGLAIEARGRPFGKVIVRAIDRWERMQPMPGQSTPRFMGWWTVPGVYEGTYGG
jgi:hypothetical protein